MTCADVTRIAFAVSILSLMLGAGEVNAQPYSAGQLRYYCSLGAQTPRSVRPYCGGYAPRYSPPPRYAPAPAPRYYGYYNNRGLSRSELAYYCSLGSQTPYSVRRYCGQYGFW